MMDCFFFIHIIATNRSLGGKMERFGFLCLGKLFVFYVDNAAEDVAAAAASLVLIRDWKNSKAWMPLIETV